jgi:endonuclease/exonuclease/phosphatase family metal-dependent hydrolase
MKHRTISTIFFLLILVSCNIPPIATKLPAITPISSPTTEPLLTVKVMSYNILWGAGVNREFDKNLSAPDFKYYQSGKSRLPELLSVIKEWDPDILGIQEGAGWDRGEPSVIEKVAKELNMNYFLAKGAASELNVMLLSKYKIVETENLSPEIGNVGALRAKLITPDGQPLNVFVVHLDNSSEDLRSCEVNTLVQYVQPYLEQRVLIMGDFNTYQGALEMKPIEMEPIAMKQVAISAPGIDQIWISSSTNWSKSDWFKSFAPRDLISDHLPVGAEISIFLNQLPSTTFPPILPTPIIEPAPLVSDLIQNPRILRFDNFENTCTKSKWNSDWTTEKFSEGMIAVVGEGNWQSGVSRNKDFSEGQGVILRFMFEKGTEASLFIDNGDWNTDPYRRFGLSIEQDSIQTDLWQGREGMGGKNLNGNFEPKPETWYNLMIVISKNGEFLEAIWDPNDPTRVISYQEQLGKKWIGFPWRFSIGTNIGNVLIDDYSEIIFDKIK